MVRHSDLAINKRHWSTMSYILLELTVGSHDAFGLPMIGQLLHTESVRYWGILGHVAID